MEQHLTGLHGSCVGGVDLGGVFGSPGQAPGLLAIGAARIVPVTENASATQAADYQTNLRTEYGYDQSGNLLVCSVSHNACVGYLYTLSLHFINCRLVLGAKFGNGHSAPQI